MMTLLTSLYVSGSKDAAKNLSVMMNKYNEVLALRVTLHLHCMSKASDTVVFCWLTTSTLASKSNALFLLYVDVLETPRNSPAHKPLRELLETEIQSRAIGASMKREITSALNLSHPREMC